MAEPTTNIRHLVKDAFIQLLRDHPALAGVQVEYGWPGDMLEADSIFVAGCDGNTEVPHMKSGRRHRQDDFTMTVVVQAGLVGDTDPADTETRAAELLTAIDDTLADYPTLNDLPGLHDFGEQMRIDGPNTYRTKQGCISFYLCEIDAATRYQ